MPKPEPGAGAGPPFLPSFPACLFSVSPSQGKAWGGSVARNVEGMLCAHLILANGLLGLRGL